jgi:sarcosine oxidase subunit gamma
MLSPRTAFGKTEAETHTIGPYRIAERFDVALASVAVRRGQDKALAKAAKSVGLPLPAPALAVEGNPWSAFWMTPEMWMVEAPFASHEDITGHLKPALGAAASVTEQTDAWVRFDLSAPDLTPLMERLTNLDLPTKPAGFSARTVIEHLGVYLIQRAPGEVTIYGPRASAQSLLHAIEVAAKSVF